jgi:hypothetical protein
LADAEGSGGGGAGGGGGGGGGMPADYLAWLRLHGQPTNCPERVLSEEHAAALSSTAGTYAWVRRTSGPAERFEAEAAAIPAFRKLLSARVRPARGTDRVAGRACRAGAGRELLGLLRQGYNTTRRFRGTRHQKKSVGKAKGIGAAAATARGARSRKEAAAQEGGAAAGLDEFPHRG